jgi:hypothetical protein
VAAQLRYFMLPDDERAVFRLLARHSVTLFPELVPPDWVAPRVDDALLPSALDLDAYYLAFEELGPVIVHPVKKGPDKGMLKIEELPSPVFHYERSVRNEAGELVGGRLWAELDVHETATGPVGKPRRLHVVFDEIHQLFKKNWRRSDPKGWWVGPAAARAWKSDKLVLREPGHKGGTLGVWK